MLECHVEYLKVLNPTMSFTNGDLVRLPIRIEEPKIAFVSELVDGNVTISKDDWNPYETSWDFKRNPLV